MLVFIFIFGICIGSFLNVIALRAFTGESIVLPPSKCPHCKYKLQPYDNIPILSYLILGGKCRNCKAPISPQYPIVELITGLTFISAYFYVGFIGPQFLFLCMMLGLFIVLCITDIKEHVIFVEHTYVLAAFGFLYNALGLPSFTIWDSFKVSFIPAWVHIPIVSSILGAILGALAMELMARLSILMVKVRGFGEGDNYIAGALGAIFGVYAILPIIFWSIIIQAISNLPVFIAKLYKQKDYTQLLALTLFAGSVILVKVCDRLGYLENMYVLTVVMLQMIIFGLYSCRKVLQGMKTTEDLIKLPFGPALVVTATVVMFFGMRLTM